MEGYSFRKKRFGRRGGFLSSLSTNTIIILINVAFFVVAFILLGIFGKIVWDYIALNPSNVLQGKSVWTFLTSMFMHGGFFHLFVNMLSLFFVGSLLQKIIGEKRYLKFYLLSGIFSGLFFVLIALLTGSGLDAYAVGASGALFGVIGCLIFLTPNLPVYVMFIPIPIKLKYAGPGLLLVLWGISEAAGLPIGNFAHLGGLIAGLFYGIFLTNKYKKKTRMIRRRFS